MEIFELIQIVWLFCVLTIRNKPDKTVFQNTKFATYTILSSTCVYTTNWLSKKANTEINKVAIILNLVLGVTNEKYLIDTSLGLGIRTFVQKIMTHGEDVRPMS